MTGFYWHIFIFCVLFIFLVLMVYRIVSIERLPVHLRWELAPLPHEKEKGGYSGSDVGERRFWHKKRRKSPAAVLIYMAGEIFLQRGVWKNNCGLWPFTFLMHIGIYLVIISIIVHVINALFIINGTSAAVLDVFRTIAALTAIIGYILGILGTIGLILKRSIDINFRVYSAFPAYFRLYFLSAVFISGIIAWFFVRDFAAEMSIFTRDLLTLNSGITATVPLASHIIIFSLFLVYLPLTDMIHFIAKYFTYHAVRWDDAPLDRKMEAELSKLNLLTTNWSAPHIKPGRTWAEITADGTRNEKTS